MPPQPTDEFLFEPPYALTVPPILPDTRGPARDLFKHYGNRPCGQTVYWNGSTFVTTSYPSGDLLSGLEEGVTYFLGGHQYRVNQLTSVLLEGAGYTTTFVG